MSAEPWTIEQLQSLLNQIKARDGIACSDNRKLLWLALHTTLWKSSPIAGVEAEIINEIECRLYPEYDGGSVTVEPWGWRTPDGDIRYI